jgi:hypothetical protein
MGSFIAERGLAEEMFRLAVEACPNGMVMVDSDNNMVMVNTEIDSALSKMNCSIESLSVAVRDQLAIKPAQPVKEVA